MDKKKIIWALILVIALVAAIYSIYLLTTWDQKSAEESIKENWQKEIQGIPTVNYGQWKEDIYAGFIKEFAVKELAWKKGRDVKKQEFHLFLTYTNDSVYLGKVPEGKNKYDLMATYDLAADEARIKARPPIFYNDELKEIRIEENVWRKAWNIWNKNDGTLYLVAAVMLGVLIGFVRWIKTRGRLKLPPPYKTRITFADVEAPKEITKIIEEIIAITKYPQIFLEKGGMLPHGFLFCGPPGTGKSLAAAAVANKLTEEGILFYYISCAALVGDTFGETGAIATRIHDIFRQLKEKKQPCCLILNDIEKLAKKDSAGSHLSFEYSAGLSQLLEEISGLDEYAVSTYKEGKLEGAVVVIAITNKPELVHDAFRRSGRIDETIEFALPAEKERKSILLILSRGMDIPGDKKEEWLDGLAQKSEGFSGADLREVLRKAANLCVRKKVFIKIRNKQAVAPTEARIDQEDLEEALKWVLENKNKAQ